MAEGGELVEEEERGANVGCGACGTWSGLEAPCGPSEAAGAPTGHVVPSDALERPESAYAASGGRESASLAISPSVWETRRRSQRL